MKQYHYHPDKVFIIRANNQVIAFLLENEIEQFSNLSLPQEFSEILILEDGIVYATINKAMESINYNPLEELISKEQQIIDFYNAKFQTVE